MAGLDKKRNLSHQGERGAAVFVVVMAILVITSLGTWSIYSAGLTSAGSGYQRSAAQALAVAELGIVAGTGYLSIPGYASANYAQAKKDLNGTPDSCRSVTVDSGSGGSSGSGSARFCKSIYMSDIDETIQTETSHNLLDQATGSPQGSMGPIAKEKAGGQEGHFILEMSNPKPVLVAGTDVSKGTYQRVTLTSYGLVRPYNSAGLCTAAESASATQVAMRAEAIIGPLDP